MQCGGESANELEHVQAATLPTRASTPTSTTLVRSSCREGTTPSEVGKELEQHHQQEEEHQLLRAVTSIPLQERIEEIWCWAKGERGGGETLEIRLWNACLLWGFKTKGVWGASIGDKLSPAFLVQFTSVMTQGTEGWGASSENL